MCFFPHEKPKYWKPLQTENRNLPQQNTHAHTHTHTCTHTGMYHRTQNPHTGRSKAQQDYKISAGCFQGPGEDCRPVTAAPAHARAARTYTNSDLATANEAESRLYHSDYAPTDAGTQTPPLYHAIKIGRHAHTLGSTCLHKDHHQHKGHLSAWRCVPFCWI